MKMGVSASMLCPLEISTAVLAQHRLLSHIVWWHHQACSVMSDSLFIALMLHLKDDAWGLDGCGEFANRGGPCPELPDLWVGAGMQL
jgi:hypothetical protein